MMILERSSVPWPVEHLAVTGRLIVRFIAVFCILLSCGFGSMRLAEANWREETGTFRIGFIATRAMVSSVADVEPFRLAVEEKLGLPVEMLPMRDLSRLAGAHVDGRIEYAIYPATTYAAAWVNCECIEPVAVAMAGDKTTAVHAVVIGRTASNVSRPEDISGGKLWLLTDDEAILQQIAISELRKDGVAIDQGNTEFLSASAPREAMTRFISGEGDAIIGWSSMAGDVATGYSRGTLKTLVELDTTPNRYSVVWQSQAIPHRVHAVRKNLDGEAKRILRDTLAAMFDGDPVAYDSIEPVYGGGFQILPQSAFSGVVAFIRTNLPEGAKSDDPDAGVNPQEGSSDSRSGE